MCRLLRITILVFSLLGLTSGVFWIRSYRVPRTDTYYSSAASSVLYIGSVEGSLFLNYTRFGGAGPKEAFYFCPWRAPWQFDCARYKGWFYVSVACPHWFAVFSFSVGAMLSFALARRHRRRGVPGFCPNCGYDLRASPERCPECGMPRAAGSRAVR